jgi:hypothetical protein
MVVLKVDRSAGLLAVSLAGQRAARKVATLVVQLVVRMAEK